MAEISEKAGALWAKKNDCSGTFSWLPLMVHLQDTMQVAGFLWNHWMSQGQRDGIISQIKNGNEELAENLVQFLGGIHDIGKATPVFQAQKGFSSSKDLDQELLEKLERAGFRGIAAFDPKNKRYSHHALAGAWILRKFGVREDVASIVDAHHGKPVDDEEAYSRQAAYISNYYQTEDLESDAHKRWEDVQRSIFTWALKQSGLDRIENIPEISEPAQVLLSGLVIMADWIASNEAYFPLLPIAQAHVANSSERYRTGIQKWFCSRPLEVTEPDDAEALYQARFGFRPRDFQKKIFETVQGLSKPGIMIIEAPTGCGKTEAALAAAEQTAAKTGRSGLFFGLPTQATSNGMFSRVCDWLKNVSDAYGLPLPIRLQHGKAALNPLMNQLASTHIDEDSGSDGAVIVNQWFFGRKKAILDDDVVGTVDQFLLASLKQKHLALRHLGLDKKVVVIDEVHAYDAYMQQYLDQSLKWMGAYGVPVILLSATLPAEKRQDFIVAYLRGTGIKKREIEWGDVDFKTRHYPLMTYTEGARVFQETGFSMQQNKTVQIKKLKEDDLYDKIAELIQDGGVLGIVVNTVRRAQKIAQRCSEGFGEDTVLLLHSNFIATDRITKEDELLHLIGKDGRRPKRLIVVGTQVIEQSLDIDFDVLITDLCPMDLMIQRIGRLQRHDIARPQNHQSSVVYVMGAEEPLVFEKGSTYVYEKYLLARTQAFLPSAIHIPEDVSHLVQKTYDFKHAEPEYYGDQLAEYLKYKKAFEVHRANKQEKAKTFQIDKPSMRINPKRYNLTGWLTTPDESDSEEKACAQVRDTNETIEVIAVQKREGGYGIFTPKTPSDRDISDQISDPETAKKLAAQTLRLPPSVIRGNPIDKVIEGLENYNRRNLKNWQNQPWLKGTLGVIFDENGIFRMADLNIDLQYDNQYGLRTIEEEVK
ncbi:CRISPR-associated helicase Cas3' [Pseudoramibacter sp.]|jgi:CRISPR-associated endonuclease/helicase Cas3|uniref:CRISPR-associated helicase Cas3' n=1 Tax=Pseudoramibacter sp. TaxID=2034862 RepID=UPI0025E5A6BF|nr:CRISPR-associated helicase Cas3' [Pseudoramibacter sp.]MCH4071740.1 CRISPR-associated helicase Cas3' [Pseudoramibacter sp.]MCH4105508.1 CRISPR-associated helicase Cas3' [Pseudoramibacter sp.]